MQEMRTRSGFCYPVSEKEAEDLQIGLKRRRISPIVGGGNGGGTFDLFQSLPEDLVLSILCKLSSSASSPADFINFMITCKKLNKLGLNCEVLSKASKKMFEIKADNWSESANGFLKLCADSGNVEAMYTLGMIRFYCLQQRSSGVSLMGKAAIESHAPALYSLAIIQFNGSGGSKNNKDLNAGVTLCARAASIGHIDAVRELGHCYQDGYGVKKNVDEGRRLLFRATALLVAAALSIDLSALTSDQMRCFGCENISAPKAESVNRFLMEWFAAKGSGLKPGFLRLCSNSICGRIETRRHEFRGCSACGVVNYCSRACQSIDWRVRHKAECILAAVAVNIEEYEVDGEGNGDVVVIPEDDGEGNR